MNISIRVHEDFDLGGGYALTQGIHDVPREDLIHYETAIKDGRFFFSLEINKFEELNQQLNEQIFNLYQSDAEIKNSIPSVPLTNKGDILGFSTANVRIPVGANDSLFMADSAQAMGVKWGSLVSSQIPNLATSKITSGQFDTARMLASAGNNQVAYLNSSQILTSNSNFTFNGNTLETITSSNSAVPLRVKGASSQANNSNYFDIRRSDNAVIFSVKEDSVGGVMNLHSNNGGVVGFYRVNSSGAVQGLDIAGYNALNFINVGSTINPLQLKAFGSAGGLINLQYLTYYSNVYFTGYTGGGTNGGEVVFDDLQSGLTTMHVYTSNNSNMGVRIPNGKVGIGSTGVPNAKLDVVSTTEQFRRGYDSSNYTKETTASNGENTIDVVGSVAQTKYADPVIINGLRIMGYTSSSGYATTTQLPNDRDVCIHENMMDDTVWLSYNFQGSILKVQLS